MNGHGVLGRLLRLGVLRGLVGMALLGGVGRSRFGRVGLMLGDVWMCDLGSGDRSRQDQSNEKRQELPSHVIIFGRESPWL